MAKFIKITDFQQNYAEGTCVTKEYIINVDQIVSQYNAFNPEREEYMRKDSDIEPTPEEPNISLPDRHIVMSNGADYIIGEDEWCELMDIMEVKEADWQGYYEWCKNNK